MEITSKTYLSLYNKEFEVVTNLGENKFYLNCDFWMWWIEAASFNGNLDTCDFCFVCDKEYEVLNNIPSSQFCDKSIWKNSLIERAIFERCEYKNIILTDGKNEVNLNTKNELFSKKDVKRFYTNIHLKNNKKSAKASFSEDLTPLAAYFVNRIKEDNRN